MDFIKKERWSLRVLVLVVLFNSLISAVFFPKYSEAMAIVALLLGFFAFKGLHLKLAQQPILVYERWLLGSFALLTVISVLSFLCWPATRDAHMRVEDDLKFLLFIPLYLLLRCHRIPARYFVAGFGVVAILLAIVSLGQYLKCSWVLQVYGYSLRPSAAVNPMRYAVVALVLSGFLVNAWFVFRYKSFVLKSLCTLAALSGLLACVLTQTRGVWLALPLLIIGYAYFQSSIRGLRSMFLVFLVGIVLLGFISQQPFVEKRFDKTVKNLERYLEGDGHSSLGVRLDMYKASIILAKDKPIFGHGLGVFKEESKKLRESGLLGDKVSRQVGTRRTPHNEFFQALVERGVIGLIATVLLFCVPVMIFYGGLKSSLRSVHYFSFSGLVLMSVLFMAAQTGTLFNHNLIANFYIILTLIFVSQIRVRENSEVNGIDGPARC